MSKPYDCYKTCKCIFIHFGTEWLAYSAATKKLSSHALQWNNFFNHIWCKSRGTAEFSVNNVYSEPACTWSIPRRDNVLHAARKTLNSSLTSDRFYYWRDKQSTHHFEPLLKHEPQLSEIPLTYNHNILGVNLEEFLYKSVITTTYP